MLTARVGIAAVAVCRPLPFINGRPPRLADVVTELARVGGAQKS
jgi:putative membrane protein